MRVTAHEKLYKKTPYMSKIPGFPSIDNETNN